MAGRLKFADFVFDRLPSGSCRCRVLLEWDPQRQFPGEAEGVASQAGALRCAAQAAVSALEQAVDERVTFELLGVKAVKAFDATVVIVSLAVHGLTPPARTVGSYLTERELERGAVVAVLNATNRLLGNILARTEKT